MKIYRLLPALMLLCFGCLESEDPQRQVEREIIAIENDFNEYVSKKGIQNAFLAFAADSAVIVRGDRIIKGKKAIGNYFSHLPYRNIKLSWSPEHVSASKSGDMAYTYGKYLFSAVDSSGKIVEQRGIFHTVWKRQVDGTWKYVYD